MRKPVSSFKQRWRSSLLLLSLVALAGPAAAHTYPNYIFPNDSRTSHAVSAMTLSGDRVEILRPLPRHAIGIVDSNLSFPVELLRTCSSGGGNMACTLYLDGAAARTVSLPCDEPVAITLTLAAAGTPHAARCATAAPLMLHQAPPPSSRRARPPGTTTTASSFPRRQCCCRCSARCTSPVAPFVLPSHLSCSATRLL
jgi:hypothetical protein